MKSSKIAPTLQHWLEFGAYALDEDLIRSAALELRALLSVARAAEKSRLARDEGVNVLGAEEALDRTLDRLARLKRASGVKP